MKFNVTLALACLLLPCLAQVSQAQLYSVRDLQTLGGFGAPSFSSSNTVATAINNHGQVVGWSYTPDNQRRAFLYSNGTMSDLGSANGTNSAAFDINDFGAVVGDTNVDGPGDHAFLYSGGSMQTLGTLPGGNISVATGINNAGHIAGYSKNADNDFHAFSYFGSTLTDLQTLGGAVSTASGINAAGQIVGGSHINTGSSVGHAFLHAAGILQDLGTPNGVEGSRAEAINDQGLIVGQAQFVVSGVPVTRAFLYNSGAWTNLGAIGSDPFSQAFAINNHGQIVGTSGGLSGGKGSHNHANQDAFLYLNGTMLNLNELLDASGDGWKLQAAYDINDEGWIVGLGINPDGERQSFLLIPVPEPSTLILGILAFASLLLLPSQRRIRALRAANR